MRCSRVEILKNQRPLHHLFLLEYVDSYKPRVFVLKGRFCLCRMLPTINVRVYASYSLHLIKPTKKLFQNWKGQVAITLTLCWHNNCPKVDKLQLGPISLHSSAKRNYQAIVALMLV